MTHNDVFQLVTFTLENEEFGIDILNVQEINRMIDITKIPNALTTLKAPLISGEELFRLLICERNWVLTARRLMIQRE